MELFSKKCSSIVLLCCQKLSLACVCFCLLLLSLLAVAAEVGEVVGLEWQLPGQWQGAPKPFMHFRVKPTGSQHGLFQSAENDLFTGDITITGRVEQSFIVCAQQVITDDFFQIPPNAESDYQHSLLLKEITGELSIVNGRACPDGITHPYFDRVSMVRSPEPFLAVRKERPREPHTNDSPLAPPSDLSLPEPMSLLTGAGAGSGFDDHNDFKRPPFIPPLDKTSFDLMLLPTLNLPAGWREYLPFASLCHWFSSTENEGVTIIIRFDNQSPVTVRIRREELAELAEHLLSARRLLHWLTPKLNGKEQLIEQLLELTENAELQPGFLSEEVQDAIQEQLLIVLEQPDTEFNLEFEYLELLRTLREDQEGGDKKQLPPGIFQLGNTQSKIAQNTAPPSGNNEQTASGITSGRRGTQRAERQDDRFSPALDREKPESGLETLPDVLVDYTIKVHHTLYHINRLQVLTRLNTSVFQSDLRLFCNGCQQEDIPIAELLTHAENHRLTCDQCQRFSPEAGCYDDHCRMLDSHIESGCQIYRSFDPMPPADEALSVLRFMFRFGTEETLLDLLQQFELPVTSESLQQTDQHQRTLLHDLTQLATEPVIRNFIHRYKELMAYAIERQDETGQTPLHYLFKNQPESLSLDIIERFSEVISPGLLTLADHEGVTPFHLLFAKNNPYYLLHIGGRYFYMDKQDIHRIHRKKASNIWVEPVTGGAPVVLSETDRDSGITPFTERISQPTGHDYLLRYGLMPSLRAYHEEQKPEKKRAFHERMTKANLPVTEKEWSEMTPTLFAALHNSPDIVHLLEQDGFGNPLQLLIKRKRFDFLEKIIFRRFEALFIELDAREPEAEKKWFKSVRKLIQIMGEEQPSEHLDQIIRNIYSYGKLLSPEFASSLWMNSDIGPIISGALHKARPVRLYLKTLSSRIDPIDIELSVPVQMLKYHLYKLQGLASHHPRLIFNGAVLESYKNLESCSLSDESTIHVIVPIGPYLYKHDPKTSFDELLSSYNEGRPVEDIPVESFHVSSQSYKPGRFYGAERLAGIVLYSQGNQLSWMKNNIQCKAGYIIIKRIHDLSRVRSPLLLESGIHQRVFIKLYESVFNESPDASVLGSGFFYDPKKKEWEFKSLIFNSASDEVYRKNVYMADIERDWVMDAIKNWSFGEQPNTQTRDENGGLIIPNDYNQYRKFVNPGATVRAADTELESATQNPTLPEAEIARDYFVIVVNDVRFHIQKEQLSPPQRGQEKASSIKVINPENPAENLFLDKVEVVTDVPEQFRLSKYDSLTLEYLLTYGTRATKKSLQDYYLINLISERGGHLVADTNYQGFPVDAACEVCQEPLLSQQSLTHCDHPGKHTFHTRCLSQWLGRSESETRCPYCHDELTEPLPTLLSKELESELHHAVETGNRNVLKALMETKVDVNAKNADGNTPLWVASSHHQHDMVILLLDNNADVHQTGFEGMTALDIAVLNAPRHPSSETTINLLLEKNVRLTERGARGIDDLIDTRLQQALMIRFRQGAQQQTFHGQTVNKAVEGSRVPPLHCLICNAMEHVTTVNGLPVCNDCLKLQSEQTDIYEHSRKPEQKDPQMDTITDRVYLGNYDFASDRERLQRSGITSILVCGSSLTQHFPNDFNYLQLPVEDKTEQDLSRYFSMAWDFIENELSKSPESKVFVHCHAGVSRSSAIVISYLMRKLKMRYEEAFSFVKERRACIYPNEAFVYQLRRYENELEEEGLYSYRQTSYYREACLRFQQMPFENAQSESAFNVPLSEWGSFCEENQEVRRYQVYQVPNYIPVREVSDYPGSFSYRITSGKTPDVFIQVHIIKESVTHFECDAVINAANEALFGGGGIDYAIHQGAGSNLVRECAYLNGCKVGEAKITKGYDLPAKYVLHTVAPILSGSGVPDESALESCYQSCFRLCDQNRLRSIAIPCIGCGFYGFPLDKSAAIVKKALQEYIDSAEETSAIETVILSVFTDEQLEIYRKAFLIRD